MSSLQDVTSKYAITFSVQDQYCAVEDPGVVIRSNKSAFPLRPSLVGSELRCQNFDLVKFREILPRNPCYGTFSRNFESEFSRSSDPPAEPKLESELWPNSDPSSGLEKLVRTSPRGSCAAF